MSKEAMKLALEALEELNQTNSYWWQDVDEETVAKIDPAITALREALADQPAQQEPVAVHQFRNRYVTDWYDGAPDHQDGHGPYEVRTLYTAPPKEKNT